MFFDVQPGCLIEPLTGRTWSSREIGGRVIARMQRLQREGIRHGDRVFVLYGNKLEFFVDVLAAWHSGASLVPIDSRLTSFEIENLARAVMPRLLLVDSASGAAALSGLAALDVKIIDTTAWDVADENHPSAGPIRSQAHMDAEALMLFTSGSTGVPKGVVHTHRSLRARWMALQDALGVAAFRRTLCLLPTHFGHGLIKITFLSSVPSMWGLALKASKPPAAKSLRRVHCGSAPLSGLLWRQIQEWAGTQEVFNAYGITETGSWVAGTSVREFEPEDGLIGVPWGAVIKILKSAEPHAPFDLDAPCRDAETGYIWINTPALMQGYYRQPELTAQVISGGWFYTGDIGLVDDRGWLYLKGREREEINKGGTKIYPADIDAVVERFEMTKEVCAFAVADPLYGQNIAIAVVLKDENSATIRALHDWMKRRLAEFKMPVRWYAVDSLPRNSRGKVSRKEVEEYCAEKIPLNLQSILRAE
ncbi:MAG: acyl--CoA ligase [Deltaproteobacteria bacterium]|nr:acyl--CoA ligase [Deltaproteobacteria bacterium]